MVFSLAGVGMATETGRKAVPAEETVAKETRSSKLCVVQIEREGDAAGTPIGGVFNYPGSAKGMSTSWIRSW